MTLNAFSAVILQRLVVTMNRQVVIDLMIRWSHHSASGHLGLNRAFSRVDRLCIQHSQLLINSVFGYAENHDLTDDALGVIALEWARHDATV